MNKTVNLGKAERDPTEPSLLFRGGEEIVAFEALLLLRLRSAARRAQVHPRRRSTPLHRVLSEETRKGKRRQFFDDIMQKCLFLVNNRDRLAGGPRLRELQREPGGDIHAT